MSAMKTSIAGVFETKAAVSMSMPKMKMIPEILPGKKKQSLRCGWGCRIKYFGAILKADGCASHQKETKYKA